MSFPDFLNNLHEFFFPGASLIVGGDFNCYESPFCDNIL